MSEDNTTEELVPDAESRPDLPDKDELIEAYIQYSEESRYRDGLMHNSYYFVLIAVVLFAGNILSFGFPNNPLESPEVGFMLLAAGLVAFGIGVVMKTYNRKRINAEDQRQVLESALDEQFSETGLLLERGDGDFGARESDNPFAIQSTVIGKNQGLIEHFFIDTIRVSLISVLLVWAGLLTSLIGIRILSRTLL